MVMIKNPVKHIMVPLALGSLMVIPGCKDDEPAPPSKTDLLVGDWNMAEFNGYSYTDPSYSYLFKFTASGDWQFCYENTADPTKNDCYYNGKWRWNDAETTVIIDQITQAPNSTWELDVVVLDETKLEGKFTNDYYTDVNIKFTKVE